MKYILAIIVAITFSIGVSAQCIDDTHSPFQNQGWMSCNTSIGPIPERGDVHWIQYDLGEVYVLDSLYIWNHNVWGETEMGVKTIMIDYSTDQQTWMSLGPFDIEKATGSWKYQGGMGPSLNNAKAQYVVISVLSTFADDLACAGVGEFLFYLGESVDVNDTQIVDIDWSISPNPTSDNITITLPQDIAVESLSLFNSVGAIVSRTQGPSGNQFTFSIDDLQNGLYYISIQSQRGTMSRSFVKVD